MKYVFQVLTAAIVVAMFYTDSIMVLGFLFPASLASLVGVCYFVNEELKAKTQAEDEHENLLGDYPTMPDGSPMPWDKSHPSQQ